MRIELNVPEPVAEARLGALVEEERG